MIARARRALNRQLPSHSRESDPSGLGISPDQLGTLTARCALGEEDRGRTNASLIATMAIRIQTVTVGSSGDGLSIRYGRSAGYFLAGTRRVTSTPNKRRMA